MDTLMYITKALEDIQNVAYLLPFLFLYGIGYLLKEHTTLHNKVIPWVLTVCGMLIGFLSVAPTRGGIMVGAIMAWIIMWFYDTIRDSIQAFFKFKK